MRPTISPSHVRTYATRPNSIYTYVCMAQANYDVDGRLSQITPANSPSGAGTTTFAYTDDDLRASVTAPNPAGSGTVTTSYQYDGAGRVTLVKQPLQTSSITNHNLDGTVKDTWVPLANGDTTNRITNFTYNGEGERTLITDALSQKSKTDYNSDGTVALSTDSTAGLAANSQDVTKYTYDGNGNVLTVMTPSANTADTADTTNDAAAPTKNNYSYDNLLLDTEVPLTISGTTLQKDRRTNYTYDEGGRRKTSDTFSENVDGTGAVHEGIQSAEYNANDRVSKETGRKGETITSTYDPAGSPTSIVYNDTTTTTTIAASYYLDELTRSVDDGGTTGRLVSYGYNGVGELTGRTDAASGGSATASTYSYNAASLPSSSTEPTLTGAGNIGYTYDTDGRLTGITLPTGGTGTSIARVYNNDNSLQSQSTSNTTGILASYGYAYDALQRVTSQTRNQTAGGGTPDTTTYSYQYDTAGRMTKFTQGSTVFNATYDHDNNRLTYNGVTYTYNPDNGIRTSTTGATTLTYAYNPAGSVQDDKCNSFVYDGFDQLKTVTPDNTTACPASRGTANYTYDGRGRQRTRSYSVATRVPANAVTNVHYDGFAASTITRESTAGVSGDLTYQQGANGADNGVNDASASITQYLIDDGRGTVATTLGTTGTVACTARFDPFGTAQGAPSGQTCASGTSPNELWFNGGHKDSNTGNYQMGSRTYSPVSASFQQPDAYTAGTAAAAPSAGMDPLTANTYAYVNGDPINAIDPDGHMEEPMGPDYAHMADGLEQQAADEYARSEIQGPVQPGQETPLEHQRNAIELRSQAEYFREVAAGGSPSAWTPYTDPSTGGTVFLNRQTGTTADALAGDIGNNLNKQETAKLVAEGNAAENANRLGGGSRTTYVIGRQRILGTSNRVTFTVKGDQIDAMTTFRSGPPKVTQIKTLDESSGQEAVMGAARGAARQKSEYVIIDFKGRRPPGLEAGQVLEYLNQRGIEATLTMQEQYEEEYFHPGMGGPEQDPEPVGPLFPVQPYREREGEGEESEPEAP